MEYKNFSGDTPSLFGTRRFAPRPPLVANRNLCYSSTWNICVEKLHLAPPIEWSRGDGRIHPTYMNLPLNVLQKIHAIKMQR